MAIPERLLYLDRLTFKNGSHYRDTEVTDPTSVDMCVMEAAAWIAGEPWTDQPQCVDPAIAAFMRSWNDALPTDADRARLLRDLLPLVIGTKSTAEAQDRRAFMAADWAIRVHTPAWLRLAGLNKHADTLAGLKELRTVTAFDKARTGPIDAAWAAAGAAAASRDASRAAAGDAARAAAAGAAAAWDAARAAAGAARDAARDAAWDALAPTVAELQASAVELVKRMCGA